MADRKIIAPMGWGSGSYVVHKVLEKHIPGYAVASYHPYWTMAPFMLGLVASTRGADLIHTNQDYGIFFHRQDTPLILTLHNYVLDPWMRTYSTRAQSMHYATDLRLFTLLSVRKATVVTAVSHYTARLIQEDLGITVPVRVIYNGIDTDAFTPAPATVHHNKEVRVFFSGNLTLRKGAQWLPAIAARLSKNIRIFYTSGLRTQCSLPVLENLHSIGPVAFEHMPDRYRDMDILLMPTVREGFGLSVAEAMACGLPVVASDCSSIPELFEDGKGGFLCPVGDVDSFAEKINLLAENPELRKRMGEYNRARVEELFRLDQMISRYRQLFEETLS